MKHQKKVKTNKKILPVLTSAAIVGSTLLNPISAFANEVEEVKIYETIKQAVENTAKEVENRIPPSNSIQLQQATVVRVIDGDTVVLRWNDGVERRTRIIGIDAPEMDTEFGPLAKQHLSFLLPEGRTVWTRGQAGHGSDSLNRARRDIYLDHPDVMDMHYNFPYGWIISYAMVSSGFAEIFVPSNRPDPMHISALNRAQARAQENRLGIWYGHKNSEEDFEHLAPEILQAWNELRARLNHVQEKKDTGVLVRTDFTETSWVRFVEEISNIRDFVYRYPVSEISLDRLLDSYRAIDYLLDMLEPIELDAEKEEEIPSVDGDGNEDDVPVDGEEETEYEEGSDDEDEPSIDGDEEDTDSEDNEEDDDNEINNEESDELSSEQLQLINNINTLINFTQNLIDEGDLVATDFTVESWNMLMEAMANARNITNFEMDALWSVFDGLTNAFNGLTPVTPEGDGETPELPEVPSIPENGGEGETAPEQPVTPETDVEDGETSTIPENGDNNGGDTENRTDSNVDTEIDEDVANDEEDAEKTLPQTSESAAMTGLGALLASVGALLFKRKKK